MDIHTFSAAGASRETSGDCRWTAKGGDMEGGGGGF